MRKIYLIGCLLLTLAWGCADFVEVHPENSPTFTNYFQTEKDAEALLVGLMTRIQGEHHPRKMVLQGEKGVLADLDAYKEIDRYLNKMYSRDWTNFYDLIYQANLILDNAHRFNLKEEQIKPYVLQAYFAKAIAYFDLAQNFGEACITKNSNSYEKLAKSSVKEVLDEAEKNALLAMELPVYEDLKASTTYERVKQHGSKGAVAALLAHLYAWRAGVLGEKENWAKAEAYCDSIINGECGHYALATDPEEVCTTVMKGESEESIWEIYVDVMDSEGLLRTDMSDYVGFPVIIDEYYLPDDMEDRPGILKETVNKMYPRGDRRRDAYFYGLDAEYFYLLQVKNDIVASTEPIEGAEILFTYDNNDFKRALCQKFRDCYYTYDDQNPIPEYQGMTNNVIVWRLGEIYLLRAECRARQGKENAADDINVIRHRAYGDDSHAYPCAELGDVENGLQLSVFRERERELLYEYHRWYDIIRNGMCYLRGEDTYDYIRKEISEAYATLTDQDIYDGAIYLQLSAVLFKNNDLLRQNVYWNRVTQ